MALEEQSPTLPLQPSTNSFNNSFSWVKNRKEKKDDYVAAGGEKQSSAGVELPFGCGDDGA
jgi:hypothetical protein